jgi:hypothetical protein
MNPLVGFRAWRLHADYRLRSVMYWAHAWNARATTTAQCRRNHVPYLGGGFGVGPHLPPDRACTCGLYARTELDGVIEENPWYPRSHPGVTNNGGDMCMGAVILTGEVAWGDKVIRAAEGRPLCLCEPETAVDPQRRARLEAVANHNQIPLVPWAHVNEYASEFGDLPLLCQAEVA